MASSFNSSASMKSYTNHLAGNTVGGIWLYLHQRRNVDSFVIPDDVKSCSITGRGAVEY